MKRKHFFLSPPGWGDALHEELGRVFGEDRPRAVSDRWFQIDLGIVPDATPSVAFALQTLPTSFLLPSISIRKDADALAMSLREELRPANGRWDLQVFAPWEAWFVTQGKAKLLRSAILDALKRRARGLMKSFDPGPTAAASPEALVQVSWASAGELISSVSRAPHLRSWRRCVSRWPGGVAPVREDRRPPSRAYGKLLEALGQLGEDFAPRQKICDLGASPGGWSFVGLDYGGEVTAVDRSPLRHDLMNHPRLRFIKGDAFKYVPDAPADWMIADVAAYPDRTLELVRTWLASGWCRRVIATVKFVGTERYAILEDFKAMMAEEADDFRIRKLLENRNEATVMAWKDAETNSDAVRSELRQPGLGP